MGDDVESYKFQLTTVEEALERDPGNAELEKLRTDLLEMISLLSVAQQGPAATASHASAPPRNQRARTDRRSPDAPAFDVGMTVQAKYSGDSKFYEAVVEEIRADEDGSPAYLVRFKGYDNREVVDEEDVRHVGGGAGKPRKAGGGLPVDNTPFAQASAAAAAAASRKRPMGVFEVEEKPKASVIGDASSKEKKKAKKGPTDKQSEKNQLNERVKGWQSFATKKTPLANKSSIFATSEDPGYRVGVTGSGKPMTQFAQRQKK
ncbi:hypothetical protein DFJ74DRAFT_685342 [Hyaloraphidium curvatum]|nr:hypothetical protein DFJ74DRAFT_685342 [Hyaloraphidium curvatum]